MRWLITGDAYREALARIKKEKGFDGLLFTIFWRRFSIPLGSWIAKQYPHINPDWLTVLAVLLGLMAASLWGLAALQPWLLLIGAILLQISNFVDALDGDVARALCQSQRTLAQKQWGMFIDTLGDRLVDSALIIALGVYISTGGIEGILVVFALGMALISTLISTYSRHVVRVAYGPFAAKKPYCSGAIDAAGRGLRTLLLTVGALGEFAWVRFEGLAGYGVVATLLLLSVLQVFQIYFRAYELKKNLRDCKPSSGG